MSEARAALSFDQLSEKEREVLRLITRGHDAKSAASELGLSVHTINERLRHARRKLEVTSTREAARLLFQREDEAQTDPEAGADKNLVSKQMGGVNATQTRDLLLPVLPSRRAALRIGGLLLMSFTVLILGLTLASSPTNTAAHDANETQSGQTLTAFLVSDDPAPEKTARAWLALVDRSDWQASYEAAGAGFRTPNTVAGWKAASQQARVPLGMVVKRDAIATQIVAAPPKGYTVVRFLTEFEGGKMGVENVTLEREAGGLKVVGYLID